LENCAKRPGCRWEDENEPKVNKILDWVQVDWHRVQWRPSVMMVKKYVLYMMESAVS
jgi:hypothetical protein